MIIERFDPLALRVEKVGPFEEEFVLDFMKTFDEESFDIRPSRFFMLASQNARGKTTLLESFALAMSVLNGANNTLQVREDIKKRMGRIQLDIRTTILLPEGQRFDVVLSLVAGEMIFDYLADDLQAVNAPDGQTFLVLSKNLDSITPLGPIAIRLQNEFDQISNNSFQGLFNEDTPLPTTIFFTADRGIARPNYDDIVIAKPQNLYYSPCHIFSREEGDWRNSIDNLLCWFAWLSKDGEKDESSFFRKACEIINKYVIDEPDKRLKLLSRDPPAPFIEASGKRHRLDRLSSGERARLQLMLRLASLMTSNTILLIDEIELHLHPVWSHRILDTFLNFLKRYKGLKVYYTTHSKELVERGLQLSFDIDESIPATHRILKNKEQ